MSFSPGSFSSVIFNIFLLCNFWKMMSVLFSCSNEEITIEEINAQENIDLVTDLSRYQGTSLGMYKGVFTTTDSEERGIIEINIINDQYAKATLEKNDGTVEVYKGIINQTRAHGGMDISFTSSNSSFAFIVNSDGSNPIILDANSGAKEALMTIVKENQRGAVTPLTGTFTSSIGGTGTWNIIFNTGTGEGDDTDITTQSIFNSIDFGSTTGNNQSNCITNDTVTTCDIGGDYASLGFDITWSGVHTYLDSPDCSSSTGIWTATGGGVISTGTYTTDFICTEPGNFLETAIAIIPSSEGVGCSTPGFVIDVVAEGYTSSGIDNSGCDLPLSSGPDIFYSWTSTTDALFYKAASDTATEDIIIRDVTGAFIMCTGGSSFGGTILSGWDIGDDLIIQIIGEADISEIAFCLEEATIPEIPANDLCQDAIRLFCGNSVSGNTFSATDQTGTTGNDVFYSYVNTGFEDQFVTVSLCGSLYDTRLRILDACGGAQIIQDDDNFEACGSLGDSEVRFRVDSGDTVRIIVEAFENESGVYDLEVSCENVPSVPPLPGFFSCGNSFTDDGGVDGNYSEAQETIGTISVGDNNADSLELLFTEFDIENNLDFLELFDGPTIDDPIITTSVGGATATAEGFTGTSLQGETILTSGNRITYRFKTNGILKVTRPGFQATVNCVID